MSPDIKFPSSVEEATDRVREVADRVQETSRKTALSYLDSFERAVTSSIEAARDLLAEDKKDEEPVAA